MAQSPVDFTQEVSTQHGSSGSSGSPMSSKSSRGGGFRVHGGYPGNPLDGLSGWWWLEHWFSMG